MSLAGLSENINSDQDIIDKIEKKEKDDKIASEQKEVIELMTSNREQQQYKNALASTIEQIKKGTTHRKTKVNKDV